VKVSFSVLFQKKIAVPALPPTVGFA